MESYLRGRERKAPYWRRLVSSACSRVTSPYKRVISSSYNLPLCSKAALAGEPTASDVRWMHESGLTSGVLPSPLFKACRGITHNSLHPLPPRSFFMSSHATLSSRRYVRANSRGGTARTVTSTSSTPAKSKRPPLRRRSMDTHIHAEACVACASRGHALIYNNPHDAGSPCAYFFVRLISERFLVQFHGTISIDCVCTFAAHVLSDS